MSERGGRDTTPPRQHGGRGQQTSGVTAGCPYGSTQSNSVVSQAYNPDKYRTADDPKSRSRGESSLNLYQTLYCY